MGKVDVIVTNHDMVLADLALGGGAVYSVPGNHITMNFMPHVQVLGDKLSQLLMEIAANADKR